MAASAAEVETKASVDLDRPKIEASASADRDHSKSAQGQVQYREEARKETVKKTNKATGLLGMEVRNKQGEKLGEIKDLVMDLKSGKVSYAVLAVGGFLGIGEKLLAVPPSSLGTDNDGYLQLNADQAQIQATVGFAATNWPEVDRPSFDAAVAPSSVGSAARNETQSARNIDAAASARARTDRDKLYTDAKEARANVNVDVDRSGPSASAQAKLDIDPNHPNGRLIRGTVKSVDVKDRSMVVKTEAGDLRTIRLGDQTRLSSSAAGQAPQVVRLIDLKPGYPVTIGYTERNGTWNVYSIESKSAE
jgi:hypothetical protein